MREASRGLGRGAADDRLLGVLDSLAALLARAREIGGERTVLGR